MYIIAIVLSGILIGIVFYGGLWLTVKKAATMKAAGILFSLSFLLRTGIALMAFYYISDGNWKKLLECLAGFVIAKFIVTQYTNVKQNTSVKEVKNEA